MLTCIRKSFDLIRETYGRSLELHTIPPDDPATYSMIQESRTVGVFQIESRAQMSMLPRLKPRNFYDLVVEVAIVRPGPIQGGMVHPYLKRRLGLEQVTYEHPKLKPILEKTLGVPIFQEQVMKMAIEVAGYSPGEADALRRAMGAWRRTGNLDSHATDMKKRLIENGVPADFSERICEQILGFGEYGFPESHAASFALLTYASSYLKAHYPEVFLCSLLNSLPMGFYPMHMLTAAFQREHVKILPVHTENSLWDHRLEKTPHESHYALRLGFRCVKNLQKEHVDAFIRKREEGMIDLYLFNQDERAALAMASALDQRREAYWKALNPHRTELQGLREENLRRPLSFPPLNELQSMFLDLEFTQTTLNKHPTVLMRKYRWHYPVSQDRLSLSKDLRRQTIGKNVLVFGVVQIVQSPPTAKGMFFITLEDETGFLNLVLRPNVYQKFKHLIQTQWALLVVGELQNNDGYASLLVKQVVAPERKSPNSIAVDFDRKKSESKDIYAKNQRLFH